MSKLYEIKNFNETEPNSCPCGMSRRAFTDSEGKIASIHLVDISIDSKVHYHKKLTEIYLILEVEGDAHIELDDERTILPPPTASGIPSPRVLLRGRWSRTSRQ